MYVDGETKIHYVKRFRVETSTLDKRFTFIAETKGSKLLAATAHPAPLAELKVQKDKKADKETEQIALHEFIDVKGWKALGNKLNSCCCASSKPIRWSARCTWMGKPKFTTSSVSA